MLLRKIIRFALSKLISLYNFFIPSQNTASDWPLFKEILEKFPKRSDFLDHLPILFIETLVVKPQLIVELGVRKGLSTFVLERVAKLTNALLVSVDIDNCQHKPSLPNWIFIKSDDIEFAKNFKSWCQQKGIQPKVDILLIDTSHYFDHTSEEIKYWFPLLSDKAKVFFHDTNLSTVYKRKDGSLGLGWDNKRGVIRALERYFQKKFDEKREFFDYRQGWLIKHAPYCAGFTILEKI